VEFLPTNELSFRNLIIMCNISIACKLIKFQDFVLRKNGYDVMINYNHDFKLIM
jgi:hypothetical protein